MNHSVRRLTRCAVLTALALAISVCEGLVPLTVLIPLPGLRLGLANLVTVYALCILSSREALAILVSRCLLSALVGGNLTALAFSLTGGVFALLTMWALLHFRGFSLFGVCIAGAAAITPDRSWPPSPCWAPPPSPCTWPRSCSPAWPRAPSQGPPPSCWSAGYRGPPTGNLNRFVTAL